MRNGKAEGLAASHRESGHCAIFAVGLAAVVFFDVWHNVFQKVFDKLVSSPTDGWGRRTTECERPRMAGRHDDDHRLRLVRVDQVVEDKVRAADGGPGVVRVARPMQQVENRVTPFSKL